MFSCENYCKSVVKWCRKCHDFGDDGTLEVQIISYLERMDAKLKCDEGIYSERLRICDSCEKLCNGMCGYCGCFVIVRAAKKHMTCPNPYNDLWKI